MAVRIPSPDNLNLAKKRLETHALKYYVGRKGVKEIRAQTKNNFMILEVVKEAREGLVGRLFSMGSVKAVGKMARLEFQGPNKWKFFIYNHDKQRFESYKNLREGTVEQCLDAAAKVFLS